MRATRPTLIIAAVVLLAGCEALNQNRGPDPVTLRLESLERRLDAIERILANGSLVDLTLQVDELQRQVAELQGRVEQTEYAQQGGTDRQRALYADLDDRLQSLETAFRERPAAPDSGDGGSAGGVLPVPGGSDQENYQAAFGLLRDQRYEDAASAFTAFLAAFPDSGLGDNAQYWLAETYYVTGQYSTALGEFEAVIDAHPRSMKVPDALLKIGFCQYELEEWADARLTLGRVRGEFPDSSAARLADQRLERMTTEGH